MKSPFRKGVKETLSHTAILAAATLCSHYYRGASPQAAKAVINLAAEIVDEIEARQAEAEAQTESTEA